MSGVFSKIGAKASVIGMTATSHVVNNSVFPITQQQQALAHRGIVFSYEVCLYTEDFAQQDGYTTFHVTGSVEDIETFEKWIEHMYNKLNCIIDVHNN